MNQCLASNARPRSAWALARLIAIASVCVPLCFPAAAAPVGAKDDASGILDTPEQAFTTAMRQSIGAPARADLGDQATARLDGALIIVPRAPAAKLLAVTQRPVPPDLIALMLGSDGMDTPGYIRFVASGFIDADSAMAWTADDFLDSLRDTVEHANADRLKHNLPEREVRRWIRAPRYNPESHQLTWAALVVPKSAPRETDGEITFYALAFGREGYMHLSMVTSVEQAQDVGRNADTFLAGVNFRPGKSFRDVVPGDPRASGGLATAMGIGELHKARVASNFWSSDTIVPATGGAVAAIGALSLFFYIQRHLRREARRG